MAKYILRLASILTILFLAVPFLVSFSSEHTHTLFPSIYDVVSLEMPDGKNMIISKEEFFSGTAAAFMPNESDEETLRAACIILSTPCLIEKGVLYLSEEERSQLFGNSYNEKSELYSAVWESTKGQSLVLSDCDLRSLSEYMEILPQCQGDYKEKLSSLFPGGGIKTERGAA